MPELARTCASASIAVMGCGTTRDRVSSAGSAANVPHASQLGQRPSHFGAVAPHAEHLNEVSLVRRPMGPRYPGTVTTARSYTGGSVYRRACGALRFQIGTSKSRCSLAVSWSFSENAVE